MTSIDPRQRLTAVLRHEVASFRPSGGSRTGASAAPGGPQAGAATGSGSLAALVAQRVQQLAADDPRRKHKAVRIFLESVLQRELGSRVLHDPAFAEMVDAVQDQMAEDAQLAAAVDQLGDFLLSA
jgi:hypothetical protein